MCRLDLDWSYSRKF